MSDQGLGWLEKPCAMTRMGTRAEDSGEAVGERMKMKIDLAAVKVGVQNVKSFLCGGGPD
jgi:hypothetical protein